MKAGSPGGGTGVLADAPKRNNMHVRTYIHTPRVSCFCFSLSTSMFVSNQHYNTLRARTSTIIPGSCCKEYELDWFGQREGVLIEFVALAWARTHFRSSTCTQHSSDVQMIQYNSSEYLCTTQVHIYIYNNRKARQEAQSTCS